MSRIGKAPIVIPEGVNVVIEGNLVTVKGPKGELSREIAKTINVTIEGNQALVTRTSEDNKVKALHGLYRTLISNMVTGVSTGFTKTLEITGIGYRVQKQGQKLVLSLGYSHPVEVVEDRGITFTVEGQNKIIVNGIDKEIVGQVAAEIRAKRKTEPYKGKGIKYQGERIKRKEGKAGGKK